MASHPLEVAYGVTDGIDAHVAHVQAPWWIWKHGEDVKLLPVGTLRLKKNAQSSEKKAMKTLSFLWNYNNTSGTSFISVPFGRVLCKRTWMTLISEAGRDNKSSGTDPEQRLNNYLTVRGSNSIWLKCRLCGGTENEWLTVTMLFPWQHSECWLHPAVHDYRNPEPWIF